MSRATTEREPRDLVERDVHTRLGITFVYSMLTETVQKVDFSRRESA